jgi:hypothetical protein
MSATSTTPTQPLIGYPRADLGAALAEVGIPAGHAARLFGHLHRRRAPAEAFAAMAPAQRARAAEAFPTDACALVEAHGTADETEKLVFRLHDGARVEGVIIPEGPRSTFCVSSQVGCAMACAFCATQEGEGIGKRKSIAAGNLNGSGASRSGKLERIGQGERTVGTEGGSGAAVDRIEAKHVSGVAKRSTRRSGQDPLLDVNDGTTTAEAVGRISEHECA